MDAYHAPYKARHRYWSGLLLVFRFILLLVFAFEFNSREDTSINLLAILVVTGVLHFWAWISGGVYKNWCLNALEGSFALNLIILVGATSYVNHSGGNQLAVGYTSVSIALATFIGILVFQLANVTGITQLRWPRGIMGFTRAFRNLQGKFSTAIATFNFQPRFNFSLFQLPQRNRYFQTLNCGSNFQPRFSFSTLICDSNFQPRFSFSTLKCECNFQLRLELSTAIQLFNAQV